MKYLTCLLVVLALGCEDTGVMSAPDAGTTSGRDSGPRPVPEALSYTPEGCAYEVSTPEVREARMSGDVTGSAPEPAFIHAGWAGPTDGTFAVNWRTDEATTVSQILYGVDEAAVRDADAPDEAAGVYAQIGHQVLFEALVGGPIRLHETHVCGLDPGTTYYYKVGGPGAWSAPYDVATAPPVGATTPFTFAVTGDSRNDSIVWAEIQSKLAARMPDFQLFSGDAVVLGANQPEWDGFFGESYMGTNVQEIFARIPMLPANGNHDALSVNYVLQFALPQDASSGELAQGEQWYSFDYANTHFVVLDDSADEALVAAQASWLEEDLSALDRAVTPWIVVMHHKAPYSCSNHGSQMDLREAWQPVYDLHAVDLVLNGHDHVYERSQPIRGFEPGTTEGRIVPEGDGTTYVVAGGAGAPLYGIGTDCAHTAHTESVNHYAIVEVADTTLTFTAYRIDETVLDTFTLTK